MKATTKIKSTVPLHSLLYNG